MKPQYYSALNSLLLRCWIRTRSLIRLNMRISFHIFSQYALHLFPFMFSGYFDPNDSFRSSTLPAYFFFPFFPQLSPCGSLWFKSDFTSWILSKSTTETHRFLIYHQPYFIRCACFYHLLPTLSTMVNQLIPQIPTKILRVR